MVGSALGQVVSDAPGELLIADSSRAHFRQVLHPGASEHGCPVSSPSECPVADTGQVRVFPSSGDIDACPFLRDRPCGPCSAACIPVSVAGRAIGIVHVVGEDQQPPSNDAIMDLTARRAACRRAHRTAARDGADRDPGAHRLAHRTVQPAQHRIGRGRPGARRHPVRRRVRRPRPLQGPQRRPRPRDRRPGAAPLRRGCCATASARRDIPVRYGGEEFVVVLPDCTIHDAISVAERLRGPPGGRPRPRAFRASPSAWASRSPGPTTA